MSWTFNRINTHPHMRARVSAESSKINSLAAQLAMNVKMKAVVPESMSRDEPKVDIATQLEKLNGLKESGAISEEEFAEAKAKTLAAAWRLESSSAQYYDPISPWGPAVCGAGPCTQLPRDDGKNPGVNDPILFQNR